MGLNFLCAAADENRQEIEGYRSSGSYIAKITNRVVKCLRNKYTHCNEYGFVLRIMQFQVYILDNILIVKALVTDHEKLPLSSFPRVYSVCNLSVGIRQFISGGHGCQESICCIFYFTYLQFSMQGKKGNITEVIGRQIHQVSIGSGRQYLQFEDSLSEG